MNIERIIKDFVKRKKRSFEVLRSTEKPLRWIIQSFKGAISVRLVGQIGL